MPKRNTENEQQIGRLALRAEGDNWNAYYAMQGTMDGAVFLASIRMGAVQNPDRKQAFMDLMRDVVADILEERLGVRPSWEGPQGAPEHERSGSA